jgi:hypothetical protein
MIADYTLGYPERSGFRSGTCRPHPTYSLSQRRILGPIAYPTAIMDFSLFGGKYRHLSVDEALAECELVIAECRRHRGTLVVLFHTYQQQHTPEVDIFYERLLRRL